MNIWLDPTLFSQSFVHTSASEYTDDTCLKDSSWNVPTDSNITNFSIPSEEDVQDLHIHTFVCVDILHIQRYGERLWLVCNPTEQGAIVVIDNDLYMLLTRFRFPRTLQDAMEDSFENPVQIAQAVAIFTRLGFLQDLDESSSLSEQRQSRSLAAWLHLTNACSLHCDYCYVQKNSEQMTDDTSKRAVDALIRSATSYHYQGLHLIYAGSEATLRFPQVIATHDYALQQCQKFGMRLSASMLSKGVALPVRYINQLKQRQISLMISLDCIGEQHDQQHPPVNGQGSFTFVDRTITRLLEHGLTPYINVTVTQRNLATLPDLLDYILQRDLPFGLSYYRDNECSTHLSDLRFAEAQMISGMSAAFTYITRHLPRRVLTNSLIDEANTYTPYRYVCSAGCDYLAANQRAGTAKSQADISNIITKADRDDLSQVIKERHQGIQTVPVDNPDTKSSKEKLTISYNQASTQEQEDLLIGSSLLQKLRDRLGLRASQNSKSLQELLGDLSDEKWEVRVEAIHGLELLELQIEQVPLDALLTTLKDDNAHVRAATARTLGQLGVDGSKQQLLYTLQDDDGDVRAAVIQALGRLGTDIPNGIFIEALSDKDSAVRAAAIAVLGEREDLASIQQALDDEIDETVRLEAVEILRKLEHCDLPSNLSRDTWLRETEDADNQPSISTIPTNRMDYTHIRFPSQQKATRLEAQWALEALRLLEKLTFCRGESARDKSTLGS